MTTDDAPTLTAARLIALLNGSPMTKADETALRAVYPQATFDPQTAVTEIAGTLIDLGDKIVEAVMSEVHPGTHHHIAVEGEDRMPYRAAFTRTGIYITADQGNDLNATLIALSIGLALTVPGQGVQVTLASAGADGTTTRRLWIVIDGKVIALDRAQVQSLTSQTGWTGSPLFEDAWPINIEAL